MTSTEGARMPDLIDIDAEARRMHAEACRESNPDVSDARIDAYWGQIGDESRDAYRRAAAIRLAEGAVR